MRDISTAQRNYLLTQKRYRRTVKLGRISILLIFLILWEACSYFQIIDSFIYSSPSRITVCFYQMLAEQSLIKHIGITLMETVVSFFLVLITALTITILFWFNKRLSETIEPYLVILNGLPKSALAPLLIVWLGANYKTIILTGISVAIFGSILNLYTSFQSVDPEKIKLIYSLGGNKFHVMQKVVLPYNIPAFFSLMKVNIGLCLVGVIIGEFLAARSGLGYLIIYSSQVFKMDWMLMSIVLLCIMALALYALLGATEKAFLKRF